MGRLKKCGANCIGVPADGAGIRIDALARILDDLKARGTRPRYLYTIPTIQNPPGSVMPVERRRDVLRLAAPPGIPIFEADSYADLVCDRQRRGSGKSVPVRVDP